MVRATVILLYGVGLLCHAMQPAYAQPAAEMQQSAGDSRSPATKQSVAAVDYLRDIRPLLSDSCYACHGPDEATRMADLRLDRLDGLIGSTASGNLAVVPGDPNKSEVVRRISSSDPDDVMPPSDSGKKLSPEQIGLIRRWIEQGARWDQHWAFERPRRHGIPEVGKVDWPRNAIDHFILARLEQQNWSPSPDADKEILIRRVTFDLTGLAPSLAEVDAFLADDSPGAYERVVDRLLQPPHYGEHMARFWLDAARYGDTHGLHLDNYREMWPYRDWVVKAFNENLPYDQFTVQQLAGDLLPGSSLDQQVATGFCRAHVTTNEGGSIEEEVYVRNVVDRVSTVGTVFLGLTLGCAACHDHKFDPITQKEFYQLFAFFNSLDGPALDGNVKDPAPVVSVASAEQAASLASLRKRIDEIAAKRDARKHDNDSEYSKWVLERERQAQSGHLDSELHMAAKLVVHCDFDEDGGERVVNRADPNQDGRLVGANRVEGNVGSGVEFIDKSFVDLGNVGDFNDDQAFSLGAWIRAVNSRNSILLAKTDPSQLFRGYEVWLQDGHVTAQLIRRKPGYVIKVTTKDKVVPLNEWHHILVTYDGSKRASGVVVYIDGKSQPLNIWSDALKFKSGIRNSQPLLLGRRNPDHGFVGGRIDDLRLYQKRLTEAEVRAVFLEAELASLSEKPEHWTSEQRQALRHFYLIQHDPKFREYTSDLDALLNQLRREESTVPTTLVFREQMKPRDAFLLIRGEYDQRGERVERITPAPLPPMDDNLPRDRLGLARWLLSPDNPLTSRVAVNRFWQQVFGIGLVETSDDFGNQGALPSHPEVLDWLAVEFRESGWNIKALMKTIVMSRTYRQSSYTSPLLAREDPKNRLLARGPRFRLDAETLRDQALQLSGLLVPNVGGPGVKPPQPDGLWEAVGFSSSNTMEFVADTESDKIYRRSLYTFLKRTAPPPAMSTFDAPSREAPCTRRERTNTPLQALLLLNEPQYVQAARALAARILRADLATTSARAAFAYRLCTARDASQATIDELVQLYEDQLASYRHDKHAARQLVAAELTESEDELDASQLAAWTIVANLILNLDEVVTKN
jgi:mono/diheme cytochrome c family protein